MTRKEMRQAEALLVPTPRGGPAPLTYGTWAKTCGAILFAAGVITASVYGAVSIFADWYMKHGLSQDSIERMAMPRNQPSPQIVVGERPTEQ